MDLDKVRINSAKLYRNGDFNAEESLYWSNIYIGDSIRQLNDTMGKISDILEKIDEEKESIRYNVNPDEIVGQIKYGVDKYFKRGDLKDTPTGGCLDIDDEEGIDTIKI